MHQNLCRREDSVDQHVAHDTLAKVSDLNDRSNEIIYATTLMDGRTLCIYGPQIRKFISEGNVVMRGTCQLKDGTTSDIGIKTNDKGNDITIVSNLRLTHPNDEVSDEKWAEQIRQTELVGAPEEIIKSIGALAGDFLHTFKAVVDLRRNIQDQIIEQITSSRAPESQE